MKITSGMETIVEEKGVKTPATVVYDETIAYEDRYCTLVDVVRSDGKITPVLWGRLYHTTDGCPHCKFDPCACEVDVNGGPL